MRARDTFLSMLWDEIINSQMRDYWSSLANDDSARHQAFGEVGPIVKRLLSIGVTSEELSRIARMVAYESVFGVLDMICDSGAESIDELQGLHESLLSADPSGKEGKSGSWPLQ